MNEAVIELDLHGCTVYQAEIAINAALKRSRGAYRLRLIHGSNRGTALRDFIRKKYRNHPQVVRVEIGMNQGITELVLKEF